MLGKTAELSPSAASSATQGRSSHRSDRSTRSSKQSSHRSSDDIKVVAYPVREPVGEIDPSLRRRALSYAERSRCSHLAWGNRSRNIGNAPNEGHNLLLPFRSEL